MRKRHDQTLRHHVVRAAMALAVMSGSAMAQVVPPCNCPEREYPAVPTPAVRQLFAAAERADTTAFLAALRGVAHPDSFAINDTPLIATIIWARSWPRDGSQAGRNRTYQTVPRASLDSVRAAHRASWPARERMLDAALSRGVDPNGFTMRGMPPLVLAAVMGSPAMVDRLLAAGANPNGEAPLRDDVNAIEYALEHEFPFRMLAFPEFLTRQERTVIIRRLLRAGTKPPWAGARFRMPAHSPWALVAALTEGDSVARELIAAGLSPTQIDVDGIPPITAAAQFGNVDVVRVLREVGPRTAQIRGDSVVWSREAPHDTSDIDLWLDAVNAAATDTSVQIAALLLQRAMPWSRPGPLGVVDDVPPHHLGVYGSDVQDDASSAVAAAPMVATAAPIGRTSGTLPIVHAAAEANNVALLRRLHTLGAPLDDTIAYRGTPLATAIRSGATDAARWLLAQGVNPFAGGERASPIAVALEGVTRSDDSTRDARIAAQARAVLRSLTPAQLTQNGDLSWLTDAVARRMRPAAPELDSLLARGWRPRTISATLLSTAIVERDTAMVDWLLGHGVRLAPERDSLGQRIALIDSPLLQAIDAEDDVLVSRLLKAGATIADAGHQNGLTPLGLALRRGNTAIAARLRDAGDTIDSIATPLLVGLALSSQQPELRRAALSRRDVPVRTVPEWTSIGDRFLRDSIAFTDAIQQLIRPDAVLLRYSPSFQESDSSSGSLLELLLHSASRAVRSPTDVAPTDRLLGARLAVLQKRGVLAALIRRSERQDAQRSLSVPVTTMTVGLRLSTLALLSETRAPLPRRTGMLLRGIAKCRRDAEVTAVLIRRGAVAFPGAEQQALCAQLRVD